jgi:hypothetical protein
MTTRICFMCRDTYEDLYKICNVCYDSVLCQECLLITNNTNMIRCPICRTNLKIKFRNDYCQMTKIISIKIIFMLFYLGLSISYPIYAYLKLRTNNILYLLFTIIILNLFVDRIVTKKIVKELHLKENNIYTFKFAFGLLTQPVLYNLNINNAILIYLLVFVFIFYLLPILVISIIIFLEDFKEFRENLKNKTRTKFINYELVTI